MLIHRSVPWPGKGHPDAMKMRCRQGYFHTSAQKRNSANFVLTAFSEVGLRVALTVSASGTLREPLRPYVRREPT